MWAVYHSASPFKSGAARLFFLAPVGTSGYHGGGRMPTLLRAARVITPDEEMAAGCVLLGGSRITEVAGDIAAPPGAEVIDLPHLTLVPGFIDVHVHGGGGYSLATRDPDEIRGYARWAPAHGVTSFLATICADRPAEGPEMLRCAAGVCQETVGGAQLLGLNLEGPFVSPERRGALPETWVAAPDRRLLEALLEAAGGNLRAMTVAPELPGIGELMSLLLSCGVRISLGHSDAGFDGAQQAFEGGASHVTHAFNAMRPFHQRDPGIIGAALERRDVTVELIADGVHLHPATVRMLMGAFGPDRVALITDAVTPAGLQSGVFRIGGQEVHLQDGRVSLPDGTIAGSTATMDGVVRNVVEWGIADLKSAARMASTVPASVAGAGKRKGRIAAGYDADLVAVSPDLRIVRTWVAGRQVYFAGGRLPA